jgi:hypothetical protein
VQVGDVVGPSALLLLVGPHLRLDDDDILVSFALDEQFGEEDRVAAPDVRASLSHVGIEDGHLARHWNVFAEYMMHGSRE